MTTDIIDYDLILNSVKRDEVIVSVKNVYKTNWRISDAIGKLKTAAWFILPYFPIIFCSFWLIYTEHYLYLFALSIVYFCMVQANARVNLIALAPTIILFFSTVLIDKFFHLQTILISITAILSFILAVMSLHNVYQNTVEKAVSSKELFRNLYDEKILEVYEKRFFN